MSDRPRCRATTAAGTPCKRPAQAGSAYCYAHRSLAGGAEQPLVEPVALPVEEEEAGAGTSGGRQRLVDELDRLLARLRALRPDLMPGSPLPPSLAARLKPLADRFLPAADSGTLFGELRRAVETEGLDREALQGLWYMASYSLQYQKDVLRRRLSGEYETDEWGLDWEFLEAVRPFLSFLYNVYWRVEANGLENIPDYGPALLVANHSGHYPLDGSMVGAAVLFEHPAQRLVRSLYAPWFPSLPFFSAIFDKMGQALASEENGLRLLGQDELVAVYPESYRSPAKLFRDRYRLAPFGRGDFVRLALKTKAPIIPVAVVGAAETAVVLHHSRLLARLTGLPAFPITPRFPWLGPLGLVPLPTRWAIDVGQPILTEDFAPGAEEDLFLVNQLTEMVRQTIQQMIYRRLAQRKSLFRG